MIRRPPRPPPFPYTTLFRSSHSRGCAGHSAVHPDARGHPARGQAVAETETRAETADDSAGFGDGLATGDRKSTRLNSSHLVISYAVFCLKKKKQRIDTQGAA